MHSTSLLSAVGLLGVLTCYASPARACPARCIRPPLRTFDDGAYTPGNLVYFKVLVDDPGQLSLKTADGKEIPANIRMIGPDRVYAPVEPIPADTSVVLTEPSTSCAVPGSSLPETVTYEFHTRAPLEIQLRDAGLTANEYGLISGLAEFGNANAGPIAFQRLGYGSIDATGAALHLLDLDVSVDGQHFLGQGGWPIEIHGVCTADGPIPQPLGTCHETIYGPGHHTVTAQPHIVGQSDPPPTVLDIDFGRACGVATCPAVPAPAAHSDAGTATPPAHAQAGASSSASSVDHAQTGPSPAVQKPSVPSASGGCSATGRGAGSKAAWLVMLALTCLRRRSGWRQALEQRCRLPSIARCTESGPAAVITNRSDHSRTWI
jgi:hypothetical protein